MKKAVQVCFFLWVVLSSNLGISAILRVEKDGSGDFSIIQDAIDAAENGDTIQIGPGRFNDYIVEPPWGNFRAWVYGDKSLSFVGAGVDATIIGPEEYGGVYQDWGIFCEPGSESIRIEGIRFENLDRVAVTSYADFFEIQNCVFDTCRFSCVVNDGLSTIIQFCEFLNCQDNYTILCGADQVHISDVYVLNCWGGIHCDSPGSNDVLIEDSVFQGDGYSWGAIHFSACGGRIQNCQISGFHSSGIELTEVKTVEIENNVIEEIRRLDGFQGAAVFANRGESILVTGNVISSSDNCVYIQRSFDQAAFNGNHFFRDPEGNDLYVRISDDWAYFEEYVDFTQNYWGTTDPEEISQWIFDGYDSDAVTMYIDFLPLADGPVSTERRTLDSIKAMFR